MQQIYEINILFPNYDYMCIFCFLKFLLFNIVITFYLSHEMEHYLNALQSYIYNQIIHVVWHDFQEQLDDNVKNLDSLRDAHLQYINNALFR